MVANKIRKEILVPILNLQFFQARQHPWTKSYSIRESDRMEWETNPDFCHKIREKDMYKGSLLYEMIDMSIFDFLMGNTDRHHYGRFK